MASNVHPTAQVAAGVTLGADVTILEVDLERMRFLDITMHSAHTLYSSEAHLQELMPGIDLLIGAVLVPGAKAPKLITREMLRQMRPGSVVVDIAIDQGGCVETSRPTTHLDPVYVEEGVIHYCVANMPAAYARTATQALTNITYRYVELLADLGLKEACERQPALIGHLPLHSPRKPRGRGHEKDRRAERIENRQQRGREEDGGLQIHGSSMGSDGGRSWVSLP